MVVPTCATSSVRINDYNTLADAGNVNDPFWIKNVSSQDCSLRVYVRVDDMGVYGVGTPYRDPRRLTVSEGHSYGLDGNDIGGLKKGLRIPTVLLKVNGLASFWWYGTDEPVGSPPVRRIDSHMMWVWFAGSRVRRFRSSSNHFALTPLLVRGLCGTSDPPKPLSYDFGTSG